MQPNRRILHLNLRQLLKHCSQEGLAENQARQLAKQKGIDYQLLNQYFTDDINNKRMILMIPTLKILQNKNEINLSEDDQKH